MHWDKGRLARRIFQNIASGDPLLTGYESFDAITDMECLDDRGVYYLEAYKLFPYLAVQYPDAVFILNRHSPDELWNGVDDSRRGGFPGSTGGLRSAPGVSVVPGVRNDV